ncbi:hypothetical protein MRX96_037151 [Rhipicephalus microplus]
MLQLESTIKLMQESMRQQQETIRQQAEVITRLTSQQPRSGTQWNGQEGLNCGARFKKIYNRLNRQDCRINEISLKVDNVASAMTKFEARVEARITTGFEEMKLFMVQQLKEELSSLGLGNRNTPGSSPNHGQRN